MRPLAVLLILLLANSGIRAQTLDNANYSPLPGDVQTLSSSSSGPAYGPGGAGMTWDHSAMVAEYTYPMEWLSPVGTAYEMLFPTATVAFPGSPDGYHYYAGTADGFERLGWGTTAGTSVCADPDREYNYPLSYGDTWSDTYYCSSAPQTLYGSRTVVADGYGTVILPGGVTVPNVLRTSTSMTYGVITGLDTFETTTPLVAFHKPGIHHPILRGPADGGFQNEWISGLAVGGTEALEEAIGMELLPNPARDRVTLQYFHTTRRMTLTVFDARGAMVASSELRGSVGIARSTIDIAHWPPGLYTVRVCEEGGACGTRRSLVE